jgi:hypothetical protein
MLLGAAAWIAEQQPVLRRWFHQRSFAQAIVVRTLAYSIATAVCLSLVLSVEPATLGRVEVFGFTEARADRSGTIILDPLPSLFSTVGARYI